ncbi:unnamed protein product [Rotaria socialis]|uniref:Uncharacterized protein n=1 Tax=Rotaria socialis TaxID=392032 RepID=A0A818FMS0_9BILA|nr:unnamed protein product [Rotaria socialis]CAF3385536.1 unnamed protein product [Rotaria socialis]CAF3478218.1 unnamed protein product [Rotaria socialis]CAF4256717.1 unnamed protein product [Rotaria socialis]CAF4365522.1 unnamed protein product [Rotaria socialis]
MTTTTNNDDVDFDFSQLDDTLISDNQKQNLVDYINQIKTQKRSIHDELNQFKLSTGQVKRRRTKRQVLSNSISLPMINNDQTNNLQTMLETLIYIVHEINLEQVKLSTIINQLIKRINQNELYLNQLNINVETLYEQYQSKQYSEFEVDPIELPKSSSSSSVIDNNNYQQPIDMSTTGNNFNSLDNTTKTTGKSLVNKEYIELGDPSIDLSCLVLKRKYDQVRRRTELAYIHGEKRAIGRLLTFLIRQFFSNEELRNASLDGRVRNTQALAKDRMSIIDKHLKSIFGMDYNLYRITKDCAEQVNVVCRHARNPKHFFDNSNSKIKTEINNSTLNQNDTVEDKQYDEYESFQEELFIQANEQRFHELAREYDVVHSEVVKQREIESQLRSENEQLQKTSHDIEQQLSTIRKDEQQLNTKLETTMEQVRQLATEREQLKNSISEKEQENFELRKQRESLDEENRQVHETNSSTIARLQELENTSSQLQSLELLWNKERQLYSEQLLTLEQSLIESKKLAIDQQTKIMQLTVQYESTEGQLEAQKRSLDMGIDEKNESILNLDRQLREKTQRIEQLQIDLQRIVRQMENQQLLSNKTIQSLKNQIDELLKKNLSITEKYDEKNELLAKVISERDVVKTEIRTLSETFDKQSIDSGK